MDHKGPFHALVWGLDRELGLVRKEVGSLRHLGVGSGGPGAGGQHVCGVRGGVAQGDVGGGGAEEGVHRGVVGGVGVVAAEGAHVAAHVGMVGMGRTWRGGERGVRRREGKGTWDGENKERGLRRKFKRSREMRGVGGKRNRERRCARVVHWRHVK